MKKITLLVIIILIVILPIISVNASEIDAAEMEIFNSIKEIGYEKVWVDTDSNETNVKININEGDFIGDMPNIFLIMKNSFDSSTYSIDVFDNNNILYSIIANKNMIIDYESNAINELEFFDLVSYSDLRSTEEKLRTDIEMFDYLVYGIELTEKSVIIDLIYTGEDQTEIIETLPDIHLLSIEYAPYIKETYINLESHQKNEKMSFKMTTNNILKLIKEEISFETYYELAEIEVNEMKVNKKFLSSFGTLDLIFIGLILLFAIIGLLRGFIKSLWGLISYAGSIILAFILSNPVVNILSKNSSITDFFKEQIYSTGIDPTLLNLNMQTAGNFSNIHPIVDSVLSKTSEIATGTIIDLLVNVMLTGIVSFILFIAFKLIISAIGNHLSNKVKKTPAAGVDKVLGFVFGALKGTAIIVIIVTVVSVFVAQTQNNTIIKMFDNSYIADKVVSLVF